MYIPQFFKEKLENQYGEEIANKIILGSSKKRKTTLRVNTLKITTSEVIDILKNNNIQVSRVSWYEDALIIENALEEDIKKLSIYENGEIYMQSLSSMLPPIILAPKENENILDMTAAPGGKTTELYNLSFGKAYITACEKNKIRLDRLKYNLEKQGATRVSVIQQDSVKLDEFFSFDKILLDAPCSGSGTLNLEYENLKFNLELVKKSLEVQKKLLDKALKVLKKGSEMVYSTCSILEEENEKYILELIKNKKIEIVSIDSEKFKDIPILKTKIDGAICVCPTQLYEGFFAVKFKKL